MQKKALDLGDHKSAIAKGAIATLSVFPSSKAAKGASVATTKTHQTYVKRNPTTGKDYIGRTSGFDTPTNNVANRDRNHHMNSKGYGPAELDASSKNPAAIRGREQQQIDAAGGAQRTGGTSGNKINAISAKNPKRDEYIGAAKDEFGEY